MRVTEKKTNTITQAHKHTHTRAWYAFPSISIHLPLSPFLPSSVCISLSMQYRGMNGLSTLLILSPMCTVKAAAPTLFLLSVSADLYGESSTIFNFAGALMNKKKINAKLDSSTWEDHRIKYHRRKEIWNVCVLTEEKKRKHKRYNYRNWLNKQTKQTWIYLQNGEKNPNIPIT